MQNKKCIFSVDVEDWFHILDIPSAPKLPEWRTLPSRVERNFRLLLDLMDIFKIKATCFFLGWVAERFPHLVREAHAKGHEIASHGYNHKLINQMTSKEFFDDARKAKLIIEDINGTRVYGYRCSGFSITENNNWFFKNLIEAGYSYDSSVFPASRGHGGMKTSKKEPYLIQKQNGRIIEFPISVTECLKMRMCFFGGGYLRLFPFKIIRNRAYKVLKENRPVIFYLHPREIDQDHPRLPMRNIRKFKSYINLKSTEKKLVKLFGEFDFTRFIDYLERNMIQGLNQWN